MRCHGQLKIKCRERVHHPMIKGHAKTIRSDTIIPIDMVEIYVSTLVFFFFL